MSTHPGKLRRSTNIIALKLYSFGAASLLGLLGFAGCCQQPALKYGVIPLYGPMQLEYEAPAAEYVEQQVQSELPAIADLLGE